MRALIVFAAAGVAGCAGNPSTPCMTPAEAGVVTGLGTETYQAPTNCGRGGCTYETATRPTVKYRMKNGATRVCLIDTNVNAILTLGEIVQGAMGERRL